VLLDFKVTRYKMQAGQSQYAADAAQFGQNMNSIAHSQAMLAAIRDYQKEQLSKDKAKGGNREIALDVNELFDDAELQKLHEERIAKLKAEKEKRQEMSRRGHGSLEEITEGEFLETVTKADMVVCHFFHRDFERCKIMDKHLEILARRYFTTRFVKLSAPDAPFFTVKLGIKMLPCTIFFKHGVVVGQVLGFDGLGGVDDFQTSALEDRMHEAEVVAHPEMTEEEKQEAKAAAYKSHIRKGFSNFQKTGSDEDSDFD